MPDSVGVLAGAFRLKSVRLYWEQPYESEFSARVLRAWSEGQKHFAVLERTLFYPNAGGQACDTGVLGGVRVLEVLEEGKATGDIVHVLEAPLLEGSEVRGQLDWPRRYRHMQRHTAEHILCQAFLRAGGWEVQAVNMNGPVCTLDFAAEPEAKVVQQAEALANWAVYANTPTRSFFIAEHELERYPLRRAPRVSGQIRVVEIEGWDLVACGGTHLSRTGEAGPIKVLRFERHKGGTRVYFSAGWEALELFSQEHAVLSRLGERFSTQGLEVEKPIAKLQGELFKLKGENAALRDELAERYMRDLLAEHPDHKIAALVPPVVLEAVGKRLAEWPGTLALLVAPGEEQARFVLVKHPLHPLHLPTFFQQTLQPLGARGGGTDVVMGVLPPGALHGALEAFRRAVAQ
jgi:alanyl-tRNA synthetase